MPDYDPQFLSDQMEGFKYSLGSIQTGRDILQILGQKNIGGGPYMEGITLSFLGLRADFERLVQPPYLDCLKDTACILRLDLKLKCHDSDTRINYQVWFRHADDGIQVGRTQTPV